MATSATVLDLGQRVKAKYPGVYDDLDDADVGRRVKGKYPGAYDDFVEMPVAQPAPPPVANPAALPIRERIGPANTFGRFDVPAAGRFKVVAPPPEPVMRPGLDLAAEAGKYQAPLPSPAPPESDAGLTDVGLGFKSAASRWATMPGRALAASPSSPPHQDEIVLAAQEGIISPEEQAALASRRSIPQQVLQGAGGAAVDLPMYAATGAALGPITGMAAPGAVEGLAEGGPEGALKGAAKGAVMGAALHGLGGVGRAVRVPAVAMLGAAETAALGGDAKDVAAAAITMGGLGAIGGKREARSKIAHPAGRIVTEENFSPWEPKTIAERSADGQTATPEPVRQEASAGQAPQEQVAAPPEAAAVLPTPEPPVLSERSVLNDRENPAGIPGEVVKGQEPVQTEPVQGPSGEAVETGGVLQTPGEVGPTEFSYAGGIFRKLSETPEKVTYEFTNRKGLKQPPQDTSQAQWKLLASKGEPVAPAEAVQPGPEVPPRSYEDVQAAIDARETELEAAGVDVLKLFDPAEPGVNVAMRKEAGLKEMPPDLSALYQERDAVQSHEDAQLNSGLSERLAGAVPDEKMRSALVSTITETDKPAALRGAYRIKDQWKEVGSVANKVLRFVGDRITKEPEENTSRVKALLAGTPNEPGLALSLEENPLGYEHYTPATFEKAQVILDALMEGRAPRYPVGNPQPARQISAPSALGSEPVVPGGVAAAGNVAGGRAPMSHPAARRGEAGAINLKLATAGIPEFVRQDVAPTVKTVASGLAQAWDAVKKITAPQSRSTEAKTTALSMREHMADRQRAYDISEKAFEPAHKLFDGIAGRAETNPTGPERAQVTTFIDRMERGDDQGSPGANKVAGSLREMLDQRRTDVQALGTGALENYIENYFPHLWKDPVKAKAVADQIFNEYFAKKPMEGNKGWLKKRTIDFFGEGLARGLEPVSWNPIDMVTTRLVQMDKYIMAHRVFNELKGEKLLKFVRSGEKPPEGYRQIDDKIATVYGPRKGAVALPEESPYSVLPGEEMVEGGIRPEDVTVFGQRIMGKYYAPEAVAGVINNHLSPGLRGSETVGPLFRAWIGASNWLNQFQLGFSAFHAGFTSIDAIVSKLGLAGVQASRGDIAKAAKSAALAPVSWISQPFGIGNRLVKEWDAPGMQGAGITEVMEAMKAGGYRAHMDRLYKTRITQNMVKAFRSGNVLGGALRVPFAAVEQSVRPVLEWLVPRQKAAVVYDLVRYEMERNPNMTHEQLRAVAAKAVDSADNRMGQLAYDNLFWNKTFKDLAMASTRSVGWNLGTFRELGGGALDLRKLASAKPDLTYRASYLLALPVVVGTLGAMMGYTMTGERPKELKDYFFPKTGNLDEHGRPERVSLPSYIKDIYHYKKEPVRTLSAKMHPALSTVSEMLQNRDYYGTEIRNEDDPLLKQILSLGGHVVKSAEPFAMRGLRRERELGAPIAKQLAPFIGVMPAPVSLNKTPAEELLSDYQNERPSRGSRTNIESDRAKAKAKIYRSMRLGRGQETAIHEGVAAGLVTRRELPAMRKQAKLTPLQRGFSTLPISDALNVYEKASPVERSVIAKTLNQKIRTAAGKPYLMTPEVRRKIAELGFRVPRSGSYAPMAAAIE